MNGNIINVGIGEYKVSQSPVILRTVLGSCVAVILYDKIHRIGGLSHVYLPSAGDSINDCDSVFSGHKFANVLLPLMIKEIRNRTITKNNLFACLVGGASFFSVKRVKFLDIGRRNLDAVRTILRDMNIKFMELEVGGNKGRKVLFDLKTGDVEVISLNGINGKT